MVCVYGYKWGGGGGLIWGLIWSQTTQLIVFPLEGTITLLIFNNLVSNTNLIDCWRLKNSDVRQYTWFNASNNGQCSRLDYWFTPFNWFDNISKCEISTALLTDHCSVTLILTVINNERPQNIIWKFNSNLFA